MNYLDILTPSLQCYKRNVWGQERRICDLISGIKDLFSEFRLHTDIPFVEEETFSYVKKKRLFTFYSEEMCNVKLRTNHL